MKKNYLYILCILQFFLSCSLKDFSNTNITFNVLSKPYTTDPLEFDYSVHHRIFRSIYSTLTSQYSRLGNTGQLAKEWRIENQGARWIFTLHDNITFINGDIITPQVVAQSFIRLGLMLKRKGSHHEFFSKLIDFDKIKHMETIPKGIEIVGNNIIFNFSEPIPKLLDYTSFGLFSIISPKDINRDGSWISEKNVNSSGPYKISHWNDNNLIITKRNDYPSEIGVKNKLSNIEFIFDKYNQSSDIISGNSLDDISSTHSFVGDARSGIFYFHCFSAINEKYPLYQKKNRLKLRNYLNNELIKLGVKIESNFFPGNVSNKETRKIYNENNGVDFNVRLMNTVNPNNLIYKAVEQIFKNNKNFIPIKDIDMEIVFDHLDPKRPEYLIDCRLSSTSILLESPREELKFIFESKEGIRLPDPTNKIKNMLAKEFIRIDLIENQLNEDSIVWPVTHFANGIWVKKSLNLNFTFINTIHPPTDFSWISAD